MIGYVATAILLGGFGGWAVTAEIAGAVITSGRLEVEQNRQVVQHPDGGVVQEILVAEGASVTAGDLLFRLDGALVRSELAIVEGQLFEIMARRARLTAERDDMDAPAFPDELVTVSATRPEVAELVDGQNRLFQARRDTLARQIQQLGERRKQIESQITGITAQSDALTAQLDLIRQELADQQALLEKGLAQSSRVLALQREEARLRGQVGELAAGIGQSRERITEIEIETLGLADARREEASTQLRDIGSQELELAERRRALTEQIARLDIRAPVSGIVLGLQVTTPQSVIRPAEPVLYLIPQDRPLVIASQVAVIDVDQVHPGQEVELVFSAFSSRTTPHLKGSVTSVSPDAFTDEATGQSFYRAEIALAEGEIDKLEGLTLIPGMPVEAFIKTDERSPMAYLVKPFTDYFNRAFRES
ncbi:HlyD family type I secretion periplasmic adaptor subunit [Aliigemmobacter aestuarii]|uniref:Membrane fusion protein (MFP) family protein n=1 Tax=Aliigemmobacter aestuarii TaxID=1445661 RepID=A0A4S3MTM6_9RHOB|nr:HlyD family type I secretion periplasmic adaptor subunit [Gemmobacter aestuarii]THD85887.1 HlyD family type I secretion periplasmic adaptor subunit [Gemmobacter aestuarii]